MGSCSLKFPEPGEHGSVPAESFYIFRVFLKHLFKFPGSKIPKPKQRSCFLV